MSTSDKQAAQAAVADLEGWTDYLEAICAEIDRGHQVCDEMIQWAVQQIRYAQARVDEWRVR